MMTLDFIRKSPWNPFQCQLSQGVTDPEVRNAEAVLSLIAKVNVLLFLFKGTKFFWVEDIAFFEFLNHFSYNSLVHASLMILFYLGTVGILFNRHARLSCLVAGLAILFQMFYSRVTYQNSV